MVRLIFKLPHARFHHQPSSSKRPRFDVSLFMPPPCMSAQERSAFTGRIKSFQSCVASALVEERASLSSLEEKWCVLRDALTKAGQEHLGYAQHSQADWFIANRSNLAPLIQERRL